MLGAGLRAYLVWQTEGSFDASIKLHHGRQVNQLGLLEYYRQSELFNHPPLMGQLFAALERLAQSGVPFRVGLRAPFALLDLGPAWLLLRAFAGSPLRFVAFAAYWLHPLAILFSAYHGNTDSALAFFGMLSLLGVARGRAWAAGAALGLGLWVKLPLVLVAPALCLALPGWRQRAGFAAAFAGVAVLGYLPALAQEPALLVARIAGYGGSGVETPRGVPIWGLLHTLRQYGAPLLAWTQAHHTWVFALPLLALAWLRRGRADVAAAGASVCGAFVVFYAATHFWAWQYLAWSLPFWVFLGWRFYGIGTLLLGVYVIGAYTLFTGSPWLEGRWNNDRAWPLWLVIARDTSVIWCVFEACVLFGRSLGARPAAPAERDPEGA